MRALAWTLLHFLWQGAAIAALAGACMTLCRASSTRYLVGIGALALMFASFGATFALLSAPPAGGDGLTAVPTPGSADVAPAVFTRFVAAPSPGYDATSGRDFAWVARAWLVGVCLLALRIAFGLLLLERLRRRNLSALPVELLDRCRALQQRLGITRVVRYCECRLVNVPSVIGFFSPVVLLPMHDHDHVVLVRQFRPSVGRDLWECPAGSLDEGESPESAAARPRPSCSACSPSSCSTPARGCAVSASACPPVFRRARRPYG